MGHFWCDKDDHLWDDPDDLENTYCVKCGLEPKQAKEIARIEAANQSLRGKAYSPHLDDEGDPILWRALEADCDMIRMTLEDEVKRLNDIIGIGEYIEANKAEELISRIGVPFLMKYIELEKELKQLKEDCEPFRAQIDQSKTYKVNPHVRFKSNS